MLISFTVTAKLICAFIFAYAKCVFSHDMAHVIISVDIAADTLGMTASEDYSLAVSALGALTW